MTPLRNSDWTSVSDSVPEVSDTPGGMGRHSSQSSQLPLSYYLFRSQHLNLTTTLPILSGLSGQPPQEMSEYPEVQVVLGYEAPSTDPQTENGMTDNENRWEPANASTQPVEDYMYRWGEFTLDVCTQLLSHSDTTLTLLLSQCLRMAKPPFASTHTSSLTTVNP